MLHHALSYCDSFTLVIRHSVAVNATAEAALNKLEPYLIRREEKEEWPEKRKKGVRPAICDFI